MRKRALLAITGTPGVGKKSVAPIVAGLLGYRLLDLNALAISLASSKVDERTIDVRKLRAKLRGLDLRGAVLFGHLVPEVLDRRDVGYVAVLRCEPMELKSRLSARAYPPEKVRQNVEAELIGVVLDACLRAFGPVVREFDATSKSPKSLATRVAADYAGRGAGRGPWIDWTVNYDSPTKLTSLLSSANIEPAST